MERVGLERDGRPPHLPWKTRYTAFITVEDYKGAADPGSVTIFKPHGCVRSLDDARAAFDRREEEEARRHSDRFLITAQELRTPVFDAQATQQHLLWNLMTCLAKLPLISVGWSASEEYLCRLIEEGVGPALKQRSLAVDELSIIDVKLNSQGHHRLAAAYGLTSAQAYVPVDSAPRGFTLDALWLWVQALYTVQCLRRHDPEASALDGAFEQLTQSPGSSWLVRWADEWVPAWCRLCWRAGIMRCFDPSGRRVPPERLEINGEDAHIPIKIPNSQRPDLIAAGDLLAAIWHTPARWDFQRFPGALFETATGRLVLPVPTWASPADHADRALDRLFRLWKNGALGSIQAVALLGLEGHETPIGAALEHWRQGLARSFPSAPFASPENIQLTNLNQL